MTSRFHASIGILALTAAGLVSSSAVAREFRSAEVHAKDFPTNQAVMYMGEQLSQATGGKDKIKIFGYSALGSEKVDPSAIAAASERIGTACQACHAAYREQDPSTKAYRVRRVAP